jgi:elongation factor Ts
VAVTPAAVKELREKSGAGMMDCKKALAENNNDMEAAADWLRKKGLVSAAKKGARVAAEGAVGSYIHAGARIGVLVEVNCETDFVARGERFQTLLRDVAMQIAACPEVQVVDTSDVDEAWKAKEREIEMGKEDILAKPEKLRPQIVDGRIAKRVNEVALLEQAYIRDTDKKVGDLVKEYISELGENIKIRRFARYNLGEGIAKKESDFAAEVAAATAVKTPEPKKEEPKAEAPAAAAVPTVAVSAAAVKELRDKSGAGMMDCKKALAENNNDIEVAAEWLRKKGLVSAAKKGARVAAEGAVGSYIHAGARIGVVVEINCETDFVARGERFQTLLRDVAMQIAACPEVQVVDTSEIDEAWKAKEREIEMGKEDILAKPEKLRPQIVDGRIAKRVNEVALLEQAYIRDTDKKVGDLVKEYISELGENIKIRRFARYNLGEGIEKKTTDFAAEVAAVTGAK